uniref:hypothetical protein n=1 Tax=Methanospirillum sp. TaxID=45200 RepID=UPI001BD263D2
KSYYHLLSRRRLSCLRRHLRFQKLLILDYEWGERPRTNPSFSCKLSSMNDQKLGFLAILMNNSDIFFDYFEIISLSGPDVHKVLMLFS